MAASTPVSPRPCTGTARSARLPRQCNEAVMVALICCTLLVHGCVDNYARVGRTVLELPVKRGAGWFTPSCTSSRSLIECTDKRNCTGSRRALEGQASGRQHPRGISQANGSGVLAWPPGRVTSVRRTGCESEIEADIRSTVRQHTAPRTSW